MPLRLVPARRKCFRINAVAPVAQLDRASAFEVDANQISVVAPVALTSSESSLCCSKLAPKLNSLTPESLQLRVLRFRSDENGDVGVGVGVFPQREEILIGRRGPSLRSGFRQRIPGDRLR